jgi:hypothetical protein
MEAEALTEEEIRASGMQALVKELGPAGAIRFLRLFHKATGDYTEDRHEWLDHLSRDEILTRIEDVQHREAARK